MNPIIRNYIVGIFNCYRSKYIKNTFIVMESIFVNFCSVCILIEKILDYHWIFKIYSKINSVLFLCFNHYTSNFADNII